MSQISERYFVKASLYWQNATGRGRSSTGFLLNLSLVLEFITRGAICSLHPALNAAPDIDSLLEACGTTPRGKTKTIEISEAIKRLERILPTITEQETGVVRILIDARNAELHSDDAAMSNLNSDTLMPKVYSYIVKATDFAKQDLARLLGEDDAIQARKISTAIEKDRSKRMRDFLQIYKDRFFSLPTDEQQRKKEETKTDVVSAVLTTGNHLKFVKCPACAATGRLVAAPVGTSAPFMNGNELVQEVRISPLEFNCRACQLKITGLDELMAAGFEHEYRSVDNVDPIEHFQIDPLEYVDREEIAREYNRGVYDYQNE